MDKVSFKRHDCRFWAFKYIWKSQKIKHFLSKALFWVQYQRGEIPSQFYVPAAIFVSKQIDGSLLL